MKKKPDSKIISLGLLKIFLKGAVLFKDEDPAARFYYIKTGEVRIFKTDEQGRELEVTRLGPGDFLGEAVAFVSGRYPFFAQAVRDTETLLFEAASVFRAIDKDPLVARFFVELLASKCVVLSARVESLGLRTVRQRLIEYLLGSCSGSNPCLIELKIKKGELARLLGTVGETLSRSLKQLQAEGLIEVHGASIHIKNCPGLRRELSA